MGNDAVRICQMYSEHGHLIFPRDRFWWNGLFRQLRGPKFSTGPLRAIGELLQDANLDASKVCLAVPVYDANKGQVVVFKTAHDGRYHWYKDIPAVELRSRPQRPRPTSRPIQSSATTGPSPLSTEGSGLTVP